MVKAEKSAVIDKHIEEELLKNYQSGKYSHIYNYPQKNFENILNKEEIEEKEEDYNSEDLDNIYIEDIADDNEDEEDDYTDEDNEDDDEYEEDEDDVIDNIFGGKDVNKTTSTSARSKGKFVNKKRNRPTKLEYEKEYENKDKNILHDIDF